MPTLLRPMVVTRPTAGCSSANRSAYPPTIPVAPTITRFFWPAIGAFVSDSEALIGPVRLAAVMRVRAPRTSRRGASAPQTAASRPLSRYSEPACPFQSIQLDRHRVGKRLNIWKNVRCRGEAEIQMVAITLQRNIQSNPVRHDRYRVGVQQFGSIGVESHVRPGYVRVGDIDGLRN